MNKILRNLDDIEQKIAKECGELMLNDEVDRVELAWWIYQNFVKKTYVPMSSVHLPSTGHHLGSLTGPMPYKGVEQLLESEVTDGKGTV